MAHENISHNTESYLANLSSDSIIGILGGMGPEATIYLYNLILHATPAQRDQDHIHTIINSNPKIPNRVKSIINKEHGVIVETLVQDARRLAQAGANILLLPCNTAHYYHHTIQEKIEVPIADMVKLTASYVDSLDVKKIGLFGHAHLYNWVYKDRFSRYGIEIASPLVEDQKIITNLIWDIKITGADEQKLASLQNVIRRIRKKERLNWIVLGCTELPLLFREKDLKSLQLIDPMEVLVEKVVNAIKSEKQ